MNKLTSWEEIKDTELPQEFHDAQQLNGKWVIPKFGCDSLQFELKDLMDDIGEKFYYKSEIEGVSLKLNDLEEYKEYKEKVLNTYDYDFDALEQEEGR